MAAKGLGCALLVVGANGHAMLFEPPTRTTGGEAECLSHRDCDAGSLCSEGKCKMPTEKGSVQAIKRFWSDRSTFHFEPAWPGEKLVPNFNTACFEDNTKWDPLNMDEGGGRTWERDPDACQKRCASTPNCAHFSFWPDGGCHLQDKTAVKQVESAVVSGRPGCEGSAPIFYALSAPYSQQEDENSTAKETAVPINRYEGRTWWGHSSFHAAPAIGSEYLSKEAVFYAYKTQVEGTVPIFRYWNWKGGSFRTLHGPPAWDGEFKESEDVIFYAYQRNPECKQHSRCPKTTGDCCPAADGTWLRCCNQSAPALAASNLEVQI